MTGLLDALGFILIVLSMIALIIAAGGSIAVMLIMIYRAPEFYRKHYGKKNG